MGKASSICPELVLFSALRREFIRELGADIDTQELSDRYGEKDEEGKLVSAHFAWFLRRYGKHSVPITAWRVMQFAERKAAIRALSKKHLGCHWTDLKEAATHEYYGGATAGGVLLRLTASVPKSEIDWSGCFVQQLGFPHEQEILVEGKVDLLSAEILEGDDDWVTVPFPSRAREA